MVKFQGLNGSRTSPITGERKEKLEGEYLHVFWNL